jgi:hypothetical protein
MGTYRRSFLGLLLVGLAGCSWKAVPPPGTGAREAAQAYFEALVRRDWPRAYADLDPESQKHCGPAQFRELAEAYRRTLGFEPEAVHVRSCDERGSEAIAHVVLTGRTASQTRRYKDGAQLRERAGKWHVRLPRALGESHCELVAKPLAGGCRAAPHAAAPDRTRVGPSRTHAPASEDDFSHNSNSTNRIRVRRTSLAWEGSSARPERSGHDHSNRALLVGPDGLTVRPPPRPRPCRTRKFEALWRGSSPDGSVARISKPRRWAFRRARLRTKLPDLASRQGKRRLFSCSKLRPGRVR